MTSTDVPMDNLATMGDNTVPAAGAAGGAEEEEEVLFQVNDDGTVSPEEQKRLRKKIAKKFGEVLLYSIFVLCYTITIIVLSDSKWQFYHNEYMKDLFLEEEFYFEAPEDDPIFIYKKFEDVATNQEFWQWMRGPYLSALGDGDGYIYGTNKLLGVSRIRQMRLAPDTTCELRDRWEPVFPTGCLGEYESSDELETFYPSNANDTGAYGFNIGEPTAVAYPDYFDNVTIAGLSSNFSQRLETAFTFQPEDFYDSDCITAWVQDYCGGGYYADFRGDGEDLAFMQTLEANNWVDVYTRFVVADITTYNANLNLFFFGSALFEFLPTGGILPTSVFRVFRYKRSFGSTFFDFIVVCFVVFYTAQEIFEIVKKKWEYFQDAWNYLDWINLLVFYIVFVVRTLFHITMANKSLDVASTTQFYDLRTAVNLNRVEVSLLAVNAFLLWFKAFKFTEFSLETAIITRTLYRGVRRIAGFVIMIGFIIVGFAQSGVLAFGLDVSDYRSISQSFLSFLRAIQGDFDFGDLYESNRTVSVLYFIAFTILFVFILMNVFLAIVDNAYSDTEDEMRDDPNSVKFNWLKAATGQALQSERIAKQINRAKQLTNVIRREDDLDAIRRGVDRADANEDGVIDRSEADALVARHGPQMENALGVSDTDALFDRFDADGNNVLDADEIAAMNAELDRLRRDAADARQLLQRRGESASNAASTSPPVLAGGGVGGGGGGGMDLVQFTTVNEGIDGLAAELNALDGKIEIILRYFQRTASVNSRRGSNHP